MPSKITKSRFALRSPLREIVLFFAVVVLSLVILIPLLDLLGLLDSEELVSESIDQLVSKEGFESFDYQATWDSKLNILTVRESMLFRVTGERVKSGFFRVLPYKIKKGNHEFGFEFRNFKAQRKSLKTNLTDQLKIGNNDIQRRGNLASLFVPLGQPGNLLQPGLYHYSFSYEIVHPFQELSNGKLAFLGFLNLERHFAYKNVRISFTLSDFPSIGIANALVESQIARRELRDVVERITEPTSLQSIMTGDRTWSLSKESFGLSREDKLSWYLELS